jgi:hypothetical protein
MGGMTHIPLEDGEEPDALCGDCGEPVYAQEISVEAFERFGALCCEACFHERCEEEDDGQ